MFECILWSEDISRYVEKMRQTQASEPYCRNPLFAHHQLHPLVLTLVNYVIYIYILKLLVYLHQAARLCSITFYAEREILQMK